jgi:hypothetical protein
MKRSLLASLVLAAAACSPAGQTPAADAPDKADDVLLPSLDAALKSMP